VCFCRPGCPDGFERPDGLDRLDGFERPDGIRRGGNVIPECVVADRDCLTAHAE